MKKIFSILLVLAVMIGLCACNVTVNVEIPKNLSNEQKDTIKKFAEQSGERNYKQQKSFFDKVKDFLS